MPRLPSPQPLTDYPNPTALSQSTALPAEVSSKLGGKSDDTLNVVLGAIRVPSPSPSILSTDDSNNIRFSHNPDFLPAQGTHHYVPSAPNTLKGRMQLSWIRNKGLFLVLIAQFFGALMNVTTRLLEMEGNDGEAAYSCCHVGILITCSRQRISPLSRSIRSHEYNGSVCFAVHVVQENRAFSLGHEGSSTYPSRSRLVWLLRDFWNVL
jgi:hypothetical protein